MRDYQRHRHDEAKGIEQTYDASTPSHPIAAVHVRATEISHKSFDCNRLTATTVQLLLPCTLGGNLGAIKS